MRIDGKDYSCDVLAVALRGMPDIGLAAMMECAIGYSQGLGGFTPRRSEGMETTEPGLFVCGEIAGIGLPDAYQDEARIAAPAAAQSLGMISRDELDRAVEAVRSSFPERIEGAGIEAIERSWARHDLGQSIAEPTGEFRDDR